jgi:phosphate transport system permease protein
VIDTAKEPKDAARPASVIYKRDKKTKASVLFADAFARIGIRVGGLAVIAAVFTIMIFLIYVCLPLLDAGSVTGVRKLAFGGNDVPFVATQMDEHQTIVADVQANGHVMAFHAGTGTPLTVPSYDLGGVSATAFASTLRGDDVLFAFADGTVRPGRLELKATVVPTDALPASLRTLDTRDLTDGHAVFTRIPGQFRRTIVGLSLEAPIQISEPGTAILRADYRVGGTVERPLRTFVTLDAAGTLRLSQASSELNMMTGETATQVSSATMPLGRAPETVHSLLLNTQGDRVLVALRDGTVLRYLTRDFANPKLAETVKVVPDGVALSSIAFMNGESSIIVGGSDGSIAIWFGVERKFAPTADGIELTRVHANFAKQSSSIEAIRVSQRTRLFATADSGGNVWIHHGTTDRTLLTLPGSPDVTGLQSVVFAPKDDAVLAIGKNGQAILWGISVPHPETTLQSLFGKVWYEGYSEPAYVWQSTAGTDWPEPKLSLIPLIFGTFKAAIYSLMLAIPLALLGAIYTSEFVHPRTRGVVKPTMELMASLPSVVVGFIAALVLSPVVENWIAAIVIAFGVLPLTVISVSFVWQLLPQSLTNMLEGLPKLIAYLLAVVGAVWLSTRLGPMIEITFFGGDFKKWTSGAGSGTPFLFLLLTPLSIIAVLMVTQPLFNTSREARSKTASAVRQLAAWIVVLALSFALAWGGAVLLQSLGYDARGGVVDTYVQRNALVVAFALAFTQIPLIYSIAEDALNAVPPYLRSGSLACGASRWQTTMWIVLPTAASGIFSAVMIGLGRAVGETMIVVMATGNTPILDVNIFNGLRTLSANINVELPEAVRDSTLYRTLFLCALVLFAVTFVINTVAEIVRQQYRKRAAQL